MATRCGKGPVVEVTNALVPATEGGEIMVDPTFMSVIGTRSIHYKGKELRLVEVVRSRQRGRAGRT